MPQISFLSLLQHASISTSWVLPGLLDGHWSMHRGKPTAWPRQKSLSGHVISLVALCELLRAQPTLIHLVPRGAPVEVHPSRTDQSVMLICLEPCFSHVFVNLRFCSYAHLLSSGLLVIKLHTRAAAHVVQEAMSLAMHTSIRPACFLNDLVPPRLRHIFHLLSHIASGYCVPHQTYVPMTTLKTPLAQLHC